MARPARARLRLILHVGVVLTRLCEQGNPATLRLLWHGPAQNPYAFPPGTRNWIVRFTQLAGVALVIRG